MKLPGLRFRIARGIELLRRTQISLRTRGWQGTWDRIRLQLQLPSKPLRESLLQPDADIAPAFPIVAEPQASVLIPVHGQWAHTLRCLQMLSQHPCTRTIEVILIDDASPDDTLAHARAITGLHVVARPRNGGFIAACNDGAAAARAPVLVFLNNDTLPQPGWLDNLLDTFTAEPDIGIVGAQLVYPDGRLQESGGVVHADGTCANRGRFADADDPRFGFLRRTDYVSAAALAIPAGVFHRAGGFNTHYAPAYYEDTDLAFAVRDSGLRVVVQPTARVVHDEGTTAGTDTASGVKAYQVRNRQRFAERWSQALRGQPLPGREPAFDAGCGTPRVLYIDDSTPRPDHDSGSLRLVRLLQLLRRNGAHVVFIPADLAHAGHYTRQLQANGVETWHAPHAATLPRWLKKHGPRFDMVIVARHRLAATVLPLLRLHAPQARLVMDSIDLHFLREQRAAETLDDDALRQAALRTRTTELSTMQAFDHVLLVSEEERRLLAAIAPGIRTDVVSNLHHLSPMTNGYTARKDIVFVGGFRHPPNVDGVRWLVAEIFPRIRRALPDVQFHCIGANVPPEIEALGQVDGVRIHGHVHDITPFMDGCRVAIAPLRFGAGVKGKINLSMAHGQPVVATTLAAEGMHLQDGEDVLIADAPDQFADAVITLYRDRALWQRLSDGGRENVRRHFSVESAEKTIATLLRA